MKDYNEPQVRWFIYKINEPAAFFAYYSPDSYFG